MKEKGSINYHDNKVAMFNVIIISGEEERAKKDKGSGGQGGRVGQIRVYTIHGCVYMHGREVGVESKMKKDRPVGGWSCADVVPRPDP